MRMTLWNAFVVLLLACLLTSAVCQFPGPQNVQPKPQGAAGTHTEIWSAMDGANGVLRDYPGERFRFLV